MGVEFGGKWNVSGEWSDTELVVIKRICCYCRRVI